MLGVCANGVKKLSNIHVVSSMEKWRCSEGTHVRVTSAGEPFFKMGIRPCGWHACPLLLAVLPDARGLWFESRLD
jgi:hypothetical protein